MFMAHFIMNYSEFKDYKKHLVFANTGMEHDETLKFIDKCDKLMFDNKIVWLEAYARIGKGRGHSVSVVDFKKGSSGERSTKCSKSKENAKPVAIL